MKFVLALALSVLLPISAFAAPPPTADNPPPLRTAKGYVTHVETAVFNGTLAEVQQALNSPETGVLAFAKPTDRIPQVESLTPLDGEFYDVGATRRVNLAGGDYAVERILTNDPNGFSYQVWGFTSSSARAIDHIRGEFEWTDQGDGTTLVTWTYSVAPQMFLVRPFVRNFINNDFSAFMQSGLQGAAAAFNAR